MAEAAEPDLLQIDWRNPKALLEDNLRTGGGVVHVRVQEGQSAETTFIRTVTEVWLREYWRPDQTIIVHVDPTDPALHHISGIADRILQEAHVPTLVRDSAAPSLEMFQGLEGG